MTDVTGSLDQIRLNDYYNKYHQIVSPEDDPDVVKFLNGEFTGSFFLYPFLIAL